MSKRSEPNALDRVIRRALVAHGLRCTGIRKLLRDASVSVIDAQNVVDHMKGQAGGITPRELIGDHARWPFGHTSLIHYSPAPGNVEVLYVEAGADERGETIVGFPVQLHRDHFGLAPGNAGCLATQSDGCVSRISQVSLDPAHDQSYITKLMHRFWWLLGVPRASSAAAHAIDLLMSDPESFLRKNQVGGTFVAALLLFICRFANCKNVATIDKPEPDPVPPKWRKDGHPRYTSKVLMIGPGYGSSARNATLPTGDGETKRALHICRGHFATYTEDKPLFGKYAGTFWVPQHMRGHRKNGVASKTYKVGQRSEVTSE